MGYRAAANQLWDWLIVNPSPGIQFWKTFAVSMNGGFSKHLLGFKKNPRRTEVMNSESLVHRNILYCLLDFMGKLLLVYSNLKKMF